MLERTVSFSLEEANKGKKDTLRAVLEESKRVLQAYVDHYWPQQSRIGRYPDFKVPSWIGAKLLQCLGKDSLSMIRALRRKKTKSKPIINRVTLNLDRRFYPDMQESEGRFDFWFQLSGLGDRKHPVKLRLPLKSHAVHKKFVREGWILKKSFRLKMRDDGKLFLHLIFEKEEPKLRTEGEILGLDMGYRNLLATSRGELIGSDLRGVYEILRSKKKGSKAKQSCLRRRDCEVNRAVNSLCLDGVKTIAIEALKNVKHKSRQKNRMPTKVMDRVQWWSYPRTVSKLQRLSEERGIRLVEVPPAYTSQTCPQCGSIHKENRQGDVFKCLDCSYEGHSDIVGAINIRARGEVMLHVTDICPLPQEGYPLT